MNEVEEVIAENLDLRREDIADALLSESGTKGGVPTDEKKIADYLGLKIEFYDLVGELDFLPSTEKQDIRAVLSFGDKTIAVHKGLLKKEQRLKFSILHEIGHFVLPEHVDAFYICNREDIDFRSRSSFEIEANRFAADMLFQLDLFTEQAMGYPIECQTITTLAQKYGASFEATGRRYIERNQRACALVIYNKIEEYFDENEFDGLPTFKPQYTITSSSFRKRFFTKILKEDIIPSKSSVLEAYKTMDG